MFTDRSYLLQPNLPQLHYGVAVTDADDDGAFEFFVTGFGFPNRLFKWDGRAYVDVARIELADRSRQSIGVATGDLDGDGVEEIYVLNTDTFAGAKVVGDRLFDLTNDRYVDLFELPMAQRVLNMTAGRSVASVDRFGTGQYGFFIANYGGEMRLYELDDDGNLVDVAPQAGVNLVTGGRSLLALPILSDKMDIFAANENGANFLFVNQGDGTFREVAEQYGLSDSHEHARGIAVVDIGEEQFGIVYGNWEGAHRFFIASSDGKWDDIAPPAMANPSRVRTVIVADFDNDGYQEIFFNQLGEGNRLFGFRDNEWIALPIGDAFEFNGLGTGGAVADLDGDGRLELLLAHGELMPQPLTIYHAPVNGNHYLRIMPRTRYGAPARGTLVTLKAGGRTQRRVIDAGSGYLCQMEPVAHFGLGQIDHVDEVIIRWLDGRTHTLTDLAVDQLITVPYPS